MEDVSKIYHTKPITPDHSGYKKYGQKKQKKKKHFKKAKKHFGELSQIVEETHKELENSNSPFRLCIYQEGDEVYIDVVTVDDSGKFGHILKHDISHAQLDSLIHHIKSGTGLILNADA